MLAFCCLFDCDTLFSANDVAIVKELSRSARLINNTRDGCVVVNYVYQSNVTNFVHGISRFSIFTSDVTRCVVTNVPKRDEAVSHRCQNYYLFNWWDQLPKIATARCVLRNGTKYFFLDRCQTMECTSSYMLNFANAAVGNRSTFNITVMFDG